MGADCPDTCCQGWGVFVDKNTFDKYRECSDPVFRPLFDKLILINEAPTPGSYASIQLDQGRCPFLSEKLCSIQKELGESYLSQTCATFPRNIRSVFGVTEKSLNVSCPEAARLVLTDCKPVRFFAYESEDSNTRSEAPDAPDYRQEARSLVVAALQDRGYPLSKRLLLVAQLCDLLSERGKSPEPGEVFEILSAFRESMGSGRWNAGSGSVSISPSDLEQLKLVLHLINARIRLDFVSERYLELYREFAAGIQMEAGSDLNGLALRYSRARREYYEPFMGRHEYLLENYLVSYVQKFVFPFGLASGSQSAGNTLDPAQQFIVLGSYYCVIRAVMIGLSGKYKTEFGVDHVVRCVQSNARALEHCIPYAAEALKILAARGIRTARQLALASGNEGY